MSAPPHVAKPSFKQHMLRAREAAIIQVVNRLLSEKGFDAMTVDEVAAEVGIAKASLYKHFPSKDDLAAAAMVQVMQQAQAFVAALPAADPPLTQLKTVVRWVVLLQLAGQMPRLPSQHSGLRAKLTDNRAYMDRLMDVSERLGVWIEAAQKQGQLNPDVPAMAVLYTLYARACDPVLEFLKASGLYTDGHIVDMVITSCFDGLASR
jgi:TetR/AcrR family transcriptional regulator, regulator of autoinduction and epiphytic fitness